MNEHHRLRVRTLFAQAADLPREERGAFLDAACGDEPELRAEVEDLLAYDAGFGGEEDDEGFLKSPLVRAPRQRRPMARHRRGDESPGCRLTSAAIASCAGTAKGAWASSTRPSRTTRGALSPSR